MKNITRDQVQVIIQNAPPGTDPRAVLDEFVKRGYTIEGVDMQQAQERVATQMTPQEVEQKVSLREKTGSVLNAVFGGGKIGEAIGTKIAKSKFEADDSGMSEADRQRAEQVFKQRTGKEADFSLEAQEQEIKESMKGPKASQVLGDIARTAATFFPVGKGATAISKVAQGMGISKGAANYLGAIISGGAAGATVDVSEDVAADRNVALGMGTAFGAGLPAASPVAKALARVTARVVGKGAAEISGALTGTSAETLEQAFYASKTGGKELDSFTAAMRGKTTPEKLAMALRENTEVINTQRQTLFKETLAELGDEVVETQAAKAEFRKLLKQSGIKIQKAKFSTEGVGTKTLNLRDTDSLTLDLRKVGKDEPTLKEIARLRAEAPLELNFDGSKLKLTPQAQKKINEAFSELESLPDKVSLTEIDNTRQAIKALSLTGDDASANLGNKLIDDAVRSARQAGEQVDGYGPMLDEFGETSQFLEDLQKGLMATDQRTIDQTYRRMATALKTNNEQRMALVRELDEITDGAILSQIAGQQLSEAMPRGIFRQIAAGIAGGAVLTGGMSQSLVPALVFASPRVTGEFVRALGMGAAQADEMIKAIANARDLFIKAGIITTTIPEPSN